MLKLLRNPFARLAARLGRSGRMAGADGITIIEMTVAMSVLMVVLSPVLVFLSTTQRNEANVENATGQQADARVALQQMVRYLREAEYPAGTNYASSGSDMLGMPSNTLPGDDIVFFSEINAVTGSANAGTIYKVEYKVIGTTLWQYVTAPNGSNQYTGTPTQQALLTDVKNDNPAGCTNFTTTTTMFGYEQQDPATGQIEPTTAQSNVNYVTINLVTGLANNQSPGCNEIQTAVALRNWRP